uniref:carbohydrate sulfotransferase 1-like n=1 Tax=Monopterus albus TaxID=43700 RepID=UPI0009B396D3
VVQLVRDPRGILASRIETFRDTYQLWRLWRVTGRRPHNLDLGQVNTVCEDFFRPVSTGLAKPTWLRGRYMLLRYEDLARFPLQKTKALYSFLALVLNHSVEDWTINNTRGSSDMSSRQKFTTVRDSAANAENWRVKLSFDMVVYTQSACQLLGYKKVFHPRELRNLSHSLVEDRTFLPFF